MIAFRSHYGHLEYTVKHFGFTNLLAIFQHFMNNILREYLNIFSMIFKNDILNYSDTLYQYKIHVRRVLPKLKDTDLYIKAEKCEFHVKRVTYLGLVISPEGIITEQSKVTTVQKWEADKNINEIQTFLEFLNFYQHFMVAYSRIISPNTALSKKE